MTYTVFLKALMNHQKINYNLFELYDMGIDLVEGKYTIIDNVNNLFNTFLVTNFKKEGVEWILWFIHENEYGQKDWSKHKNLKDEGTGSIYGAHDENGNPICYSFESTWEFVKPFLKK